MFQPVWQPILMVGSPDIILHSAERRALGVFAKLTRRVSHCFSHSMGSSQSFLCAEECSVSSSPAGATPAREPDCTAWAGPLGGHNLYVCEQLHTDSIYCAASDTTVGAYLFAGVSCIQRLGGHVPFTPSFTGQNIWAMHSLIPSAGKDGLQKKVGPVIGIGALSPHS